MLTADRIVPSPRPDAIGVGADNGNRPIDAAGSFSAADKFPVKLLQNKRCIDECGHILPVHVQLIPTNVCDLRCPFCSCANRKHGHAMPWGEMRELLACMKASGTQSVTITGGGEPCLYPRINDLIEECNRLGIRTGLVSNGSPLSIPRLEAAGATWIRLSFSDDRAVDAAFVSRIEEAVKRVPSDWAFSYVVTDKPNLENIKTILALADRLRFTHVRLVADILRPDTVGDFEELRSELRGSPGEDLAIYQDRKMFTRGTDCCLISLLKPVVDVDGTIYPCCGVQYALVNPSLQMEPAMQMGHWREFFADQDNSRAFDGSTCVKCYYSDYNLALELMTRRLIHREFV